jgi:arylsulfatase A-like enzyme
MPNALVATCNLHAFCSIHDQFTQEALNLLENNATASDDPFFMYLAYTDVRTSACDALRQMHALCCNVQPHAGGWYGSDESGQPVPSDGRYNTTTWPNVEKDHASVISNYQDRDIGIIMQKLQDMSLLEDTIVIFASDNGPHDEGGHNVYFFQSAG